MLGLVVFEGAVRKVGTGDGARSGFSLWSLSE